MGEAFDAARAALRRVTGGAKDSLTIEQAAAAIEVEPSTVWRWLAGRSRPSLDEAFRLQAAFGIYAGLWAEVPPGRAGGRKP